MLLHILAVWPEEVNLDVAQLTPASQGEGVWELEKRCQVSVLSAYLSFLLCLQYKGFSVVVVWKIYSHNLGINSVQIILPVLILNFSVILSILREVPYHIPIPFYLVIYLKILKFNTISRYIVLSLGIKVELLWIINAWILNYIFMAHKWNELFLWYTVV